MSKATNDLAATSDPPGRTEPATRENRDPAAPLPRRGRDRWLPLASLLAGAMGVVGAMLPAIDGQKVGDPDSLPYRVGVPLGLAGGMVAITLSRWLLRRLPRPSPARTASIAGIVVGVIALFLTAALLFSG